MFVLVISSCLPRMQTSRWALDSVSARNSFSASWHPVEAYVVCNQNLNYEFACRLLCWGKNKIHLGKSSTRFLGGFHYMILGKAFSPVVKFTPYCIHTLLHSRVYTPASYLTFGFLVLGTPLGPGAVVFVHC